MYWERCSVCGEYQAIKQCSIHQDVMICPHCCLTCPHRVKCPKPAWYPEIKPGVKPKPKISPKRREAEKVFMELLSMLGEEEEK